MKTMYVQTSERKPRRAMMVEKAAPKRYIEVASIRSGAWYMTRPSAIQRLAMLRNIQGYLMPLIILL